MLKGKQLAKILTAGLLSATLCIPAFAQRQDNPQHQRSYQQGKKQQRQQNRSNMRVDANRLIKVAWDVDGDGLIDGTETIIAGDLYRARQTSRAKLRRQSTRRSQQQMREQKQGDQQMQWRRTKPMHQRQRMHSPGSGLSGDTVRTRAGRMQLRPTVVQGKVLKTKDFKLVGFDQPHKFVIVQKDNGEKVKVDLGPEDKLSGIDLKEGTRVAISGHRGTVNNKHVLMATSLDGQGGKKKIKLPYDRRVKRIDGDVQELRTVQFQGKTGEHLIAEIKSFRNGTSEMLTVYLGPKDQLNNMGVKKGEMITVLARPAKIDGRYAYVAEQVGVGSKVVDVETSPQSGLAAAGR